MKAGTLRHQCDVMEPPESFGSVGDRIGQSTVMLANVPCSIEDVTGTESQISNQTTGTKTFVVKLYGDPRKPITNKHWVRWNNRVLNIADAKDPHGNGIQYELVCGEVLDQKAT